MEEIIKSVLLEYEKSTFILELVKHENNVPYVRIEQIIRSKQEVVINNTLKINVFALADIISILENFKNELPTLATLQSKSYFSKEKRDEIVKRYLKGISIPDLSLQFDSSDRIIENILVSEGIEIVDNKLPKPTKYFKRRKK